MQQSPIGAARWGGAPFRPLLHGDRLRAIIMLPVSLHTRSKNYGALLGPKQRFYRVLRNRWWNRSCSRVPQNRERTRTFYLKQHSTFPRPRKVGALMCQQGKGDVRWMDGTASVWYRASAHPGLHPLHVMFANQAVHSTAQCAAHLGLSNCPAGVGTGAPCLQDACCPKSCGSSKSLASASARYTPAAAAGLQRLLDPSHTHP